ncbi:MAG: S8 family serine peptidase [Ardenticatenaceae bacterium]|nr:S8 family serine peptidase [Ardenticatenaceae bacterium]
MRSRPSPRVAYRPEAFTLAGEPAQIQQVIAALQTNTALRRRLRADHLIVRVRPPRQPRVLRWRAGGWQPVTEEVARALATVGAELPPITLVQFEATAEARARGVAPALPVPDFVDEVRDWIRTQGLTAVEACRDHALSNPPDPHHAAQSTPEHVYNSPEHVYNSPEHVYNSPSLIAPEESEFPIDQQVALHRIGWSAWRRAGGHERGAGTTVVIFDSWPVFRNEIDFDDSRADLFIDYEPATVPAEPLPDEEQGCNFTVRARGGRYNAGLARRLMPYHGPLCASLVRTLAPDARIVAVRVLDNDGNGYASGISEAIRWIMSNPSVGGEPLLPDPRQVVFNLSLGVGRTQAEIVENCCLFYTIHNACLAGAFFVCAAGNDSTGRPENPVEPAAYGFYADSAATAGRVFPVAGTAGPTTYAFFSNESHLGAPAVDIVMDPGPSQLKRESGGANVRWRGTSFATPLVTSTLALLLSRPTLPTTDVKQYLWERATRPQRWNGIAELNLARTLANTVVARPADAAATHPDRTWNSGQGVAGGT